MSPLSNAWLQIIGSPVTVMKGVDGSYRPKKTLPDTWGMK